MSPRTVNASVGGPNAVAGHWRPAANNRLLVAQNLLLAQNSERAEDFFNKHICAVRAAPSAEMLIGVRTKVDDLSRERNALERLRTDSLSGTLLTLLVWSGPLG
jgi:hypothetical protein